MRCILNIRFIIILAPCAAVHKLIILVVIIHSYGAVTFGVNINGFAPRLFVNKIIYACACSDVGIQKSTYCFALERTFTVNICVILKLKKTPYADGCPNSAAHNNKVNICRKSQTDFNFRLGCGYALLWQKVIAVQRKPATVYRNLNIIRARYLLCLAVCILRVLVKLKFKTKIERLRRKLTCCRLVRLECLASVQINHAEFNRKQYVTVICHIRRNVRKIVVRHIRLTLNAH